MITIKPSSIKPAIAPRPAAVRLSNPAQGVEFYIGELSKATLTISAASKALGFTGPARGFLAFAQALAVELKMLRAKK